MSKEKQIMQKYLYDFDQLYDPADLQKDPNDKDLLNNPSYYHKNLMKKNNNKCSKLERQKEIRKKA